jgi:DNA-directed RNA polymerase subunit M/transcription elongation factor TFIIS
MNSIAESAVAGARPEYYIVKGEGYEYVIKRDGEGPHLLPRGVNREQIYNFILSDLRVCVFEATVGEMLEGVFGEPGHDVDKVDALSRSKSTPARKDPKPYKLRQVWKKERKANSRSNGHSLEPYCRLHARDKYKDGTPRGGKQKYRCPQCGKKEAAATVSARSVKGVHRSARKRVGKKGGDTWAVARAKHVAKVISRNPLCQTCGEHLRVYYRHQTARGATVTSWKCLVNKCRKSDNVRTVEDLSGDEVQNLVRAAVAKANGYDPQRQDDIVQELLTAFYEDETYPLKRLLDQKTIHEVARNQADQYQDKYKRLSLDAPVREENDGGQTYGDRLESPAMNPEEELMAKEVREANRED